MAIVEQKFDDCLNHGLEHAWEVYSHEMSDAAGPRKDKRTFLGRASSPPDGG